MSLLEWLKFWSKSHRIPLFCRIPLYPSPSPSPSPPPPPQWKLSESPNPRCPRIPPPKWKLSESPNLRCPRIPPPKWKLSESPNSRCPRIPPQMKIVRESKSEVSQNTPQNENCQRVQIRGVPEYPPNWKLYFSFLSPNFMLPRIPTPPPQSENFKISSFRIVLQSGRSMWRLICNPREYHSFISVQPTTSVSAITHS